jgi:ferric-dicitrate binding protein FerR (iron transport regulator)
MDLLKSLKTGRLIGKYITGKETDEEMNQLKSWIKQSDSNSQLFNKLNDRDNIADSIEEFESYNKALAWKSYAQKIDNLHLRKINFRWKLVAIFFFLIGCAGIFAYLNKAINYKLAPDDNFTTISTSNGQNSKIILPDSSVVWINSATTLTYNTNFATRNRIIKLSGQAFFQIARNEQMPLTISCNDLKVKVLGTKFDISAYPEDQNINVVLESGSVELQHHSKDQTATELLKPGEMAEFDTKQKELSISKVDSYNYTSWKDGVLIFKNEPMSKVLEKLERWYNIDIEVTDYKVNQLIFNATIVNESVEAIFDLIKFSCAINYTIIPSKNPEIPVKVIISK